MKLPNASFRFVKGASDLMSGLTFKVADIAKVRDAAKAKGCKVAGDGFDLCGVRFSLTAYAAPPSCEDRRVARMRARW